MAATAATNDFQLYKLGNPTVSSAANGNFRAFSREFAAGLTSTVLEPPNSLGVEGFSFGAELSVVSFAPNGSFILPTTGAFQGPLLMPSVHVRKGLPFGLELGGRVAYLDQTSMGAATGEAKWAFTEGFSYLPVISLRAFLTKPFNTRDFSLLTGGFDLGVGKRFAFGGMITLTPYVGYGLNLTAADASVVDFNRGRSPSAAQSAPFTDTATFAPVAAHDNMFSHFYGGGRFIGGAFQVGAEVSYSALGGFDETTVAGAAPKTRNLPGVFAFNSTVGLDF